jgi:hypothetical protein
MTKQALADTIADSPGRDDYRAGPATWRAPAEFTGMGMACGLLRDHMPMSPTCATKDELSVNPFRAHDADRPPGRKNMPHLHRTGLATFMAAALVAGPAVALDEVTFGTNWLAQAEHGGFYQAVVDGTYEEFGLDVTIRPGGPQAGNRNLLIAGRIDFYMGGNMIEPFNAVKEGIPTIVVAAIFQKDPQVLLAHPDQGIETFRGSWRAGHAVHLQ